MDKNFNELKTDNVVRGLMKASKLSSDFHILGDEDVPELMDI